MADIVPKIALDTSLPDWYRQVRGFGDIKNEVEKGDQTGAHALSSVGNLITAVSHGVKGAMLNDARAKANTLFDETNKKTGLDEVADKAAEGISPTGVKGDSSSIASQLSTPTNVDAAAVETAGEGGGAGGMAATGPAQAIAPGIDGIFPTDKTKGGRGVPPGMKPMLSQIATIQKLYEQGELSPTMYQARMFANVRQMRAQWPNWREETDQAVSEATKIPFANALRQQLVHDMDFMARQKSGGDDKIWTDIKQHRGAIEDQFPGWAQGKYSHLGGPYGGLTYNQIFSGIAKSEAQEKGDKHAMTRMAIDKHQDERVSSRAEAHTSGVLGGVVDTHSMGQINLTTGGNLQGWLENAARTGKGPQNAEEKLAVENGLNVWRAQGELKVDAALHQMYTVPGPDGKPTQMSLAMMINNPTKVKELRDTALRRMDTMKTMFLDPHTGVLGVQGRWLQAKQEDASGQLVKNFPEIDNVKAITDKLGPHLSEVLLKKNEGKLYKRMDDVLDWAITGKMITTGGNTPKDTISTAMDAAQASLPPGSKLKGSTVREVHQNVLTILQSNEGDRKGKVAVATAVFSDLNYLSRFKDPKHQDETYYTLANPAISKSIHNLNDKTVSDHYDKFIKTGALLVFKREFSDLMSSRDAENPYASITWDDHTSKFVSKEKSYTNNSEMAIRPTYKLKNTQYSEGVVARINKVVDVLRPWMDLSKQDMNFEFLKLAQQAGVNLDQPAEHGAAKMVWEAIKDANDRAQDAHDERTMTSEQLAAKKVKKAAP